MEYDYNEYNKKKYDRVSLMLPRGLKKYVQSYAEKHGMSLNNYLCELVEDDILPQLSLDTFDIQQRRYLGNKHKLIDFIHSVTDRIEFSSVTDIFAGTGSVAASYSTDKTVITNDILYSNYISHLAWLSPMAYNPDKLRNIIKKYNIISCDDDNYMSDNFSDTYFSRADCRKIGFIRENIESLFKSRKINQREYALLITSLLYGMDRIAKTCGHYDAYRKDVSFDEHLYMKMPNASVKNYADNKFFNMDCLQLAVSMEHDLVYMDPPYNSRQYCDSYHLLENVARWEKPPVEGIARKMDRSGLKSDYCTNKAVTAFERLVSALSCNYILLSYNNMKSKGNDRSNAKLPDDEIMRILESKGDVTVHNMKYRAFCAGKSDREDNEERLFLCRVRR